MQNKIKLIFGVHNHQPVGNFDHVFQECFDKCYRPFLNVLKRHPQMKISLHFTGPLLDWIENNHEKYFEILNVLIEKKQIEMLGGGFYEPLLAMLPKEDAIGQIKLQTAYLRKHFSVQPKGIWLAERVWSNGNPEILQKAGIQYTILDDTHFKYAGLNQEDIHGYYITEKLGYKVKVIPIDKNLRYMVPFAEPQKIIDYLAMSAEKFPGSSLCYADDGEKFGVWPETYHTCYEEKWLDRFFQVLSENSDWIEVCHAGEVLDELKPRSLVYLPEASYEEMLEWALPLNAAFRYKIMKKNLESQHIYGQIKDFIRGGIWPNFLMKYPESNLMYRKMLYVSEKVNKSKLNEELKMQALDDLYKGQCNCSYWHGLFGGLYLNYLRHAVYHHLIKANNIVKEHNKNKDLFIETLDYTSNGFQEIVVENKSLFALFSPEWGGSMVELDYLPKAFNLSNTMSRRKEAYHVELINDTQKKGFPSLDELGIKSDQLENNSNKETFEDMIHYDRYDRYSFVDHFLPVETSVKDLLESTYTELGDFYRGEYSVKTAENEFFKLQRDAYVDSKNVTVEKAFHFDKTEAKINVSYTVTNKSGETIDSLFCVESNLTLLAGKDDGRFYEINEEPLQGDDRFMVSSGKIDGVDSCALVDLWSGIKVKFDFDKTTTLFRYPVETISQSESGIDRSYQASCILPSWRCNLKPGERLELNFQLYVTEPI